MAVPPTNPAPVRSSRPAPAGRDAAHPQSYSFVVVNAGALQVGRRCDVVTSDDHRNSPPVAGNLRLHPHVSRRYYPPFGDQQHQRADRRHCWPHAHRRKYRGQPAPHPHWPTDLSSGERKRMTTCSVCHTPLSGGINTFGSNVLPMCWGCHSSAMFDGNPPTEIDAQIYGLEAEIITLEWPKKTPVTAILSEAAQQEASGQLRLL